MVGPLIILSPLLIWAQTNEIIQRGRHFSQENDPQKSDRADVSLLQKGAPVQAQ